MYREFAELGLPPEGSPSLTEPFDEPWGMREFRRARSGGQLDPHWSRVGGHPRSRWRSAMTGFNFVDRHGTAWMILAGLPADFPDGGEGHGPIAGFTFRASTGELRVLPRAAIPRRGSMDISVSPLGTRSRVRAPEPAHWEELLAHAVAWPPA